MELDDEIEGMLDEICEQYEEDTGKTTTQISMISGLIRLKHFELFE